MRVLCRFPPSPPVPDSDENLFDKIERKVTQKVCLIVRVDNDNIARTKEIDLFRFDNQAYIMSCAIPSQNDAVDDECIIN